tara:strand:+ start:1209 stop:1646 length:438 start_codon:yes stop_codon:yes gene_type:complete
MPSFGTLKADTLTHSTAGSLATNYVVEGSAKMVTNYDHASAVVRSSTNVSSVADDATGKFTISYTSSMNDANYSPSAVCLTDFNSNRAGNFVGLRITDNGIPNARSNAFATGTLAIDTAYASNGSSNAAAVDNDANCVQVFGDLA